MDEYSFQTGKSKTFHAWDYIVFGITLGVSAAIGLFYAIKDRKKNSAEEYLLAGRGMHPFLVAMSLVATTVSAITILGTPAEVYAYGSMYMWISLGYIITAIGAGHIFIPVFYNLGVTSVFQYTEMRFGRPTRILSSLMSLLLSMLYLAIILYAPSLALNAVTGLSLWGSLVTISLVCIFYTTLGGMKAVLWADTVQMFIIYAGMLALLIKGSTVLGGFDKAWIIAEEGKRIVFDEFSLDPTVRNSFWNVVVGGGFFWCALFGTHQAHVQRALSVRSVTRSKISIWMNFPAIAFTFTLSCLVGVVIYAFYANAECDPVTFELIQKSDQLFTLYMMDLLGNLHGLPGLLLSSIFSGSLSTISSTLNGIAAVMLEDYAKPYCCAKLSPQKATMLSKAFVVLFGFFGLVLAVLIPYLGATILQIGYILAGILAGPLLGMFTLGMLFPWANKWGGFFGLLGSLAFLLWIGLGTFITKTRVAIMAPPITTEGCNWNISDPAKPLTTADSFTTATGALPIPTTSVYDKYPGVERLYTVSFLWYTPIAVLTCVVVGLIVSLITGCTDIRALNPKLICPIFDIFFPVLPERIRKPLRFGVRHGEVVDDNKVTDDEKTNKQSPGTSPITVAFSGLTGHNGNMGIDNPAYNGPADQEHTFL